MNTDNTTANTTLKPGHGTVDPLRVALERVRQDTLKNLRGNWDDGYQRVADLLEVAIVDDSPLDPVTPEGEEESDIIPIAEVTIRPHNPVIELSYAEPILDLVGGIDIPRPELKPEDIQRAKRLAGKYLMDGLREEKTITLTGPTVSEIVDPAIVHPAVCMDTSKCFCGVAFEQIEHTSTTEHIEHPGFVAEGVLEVITSHADYREDAYRLDRPQIRIGRTEEQAQNIIGTPEELRELGEFIIGQADRFREMLDDINEVQA